MARPCHPNRRLRQCRSGVQRVVAAACWCCFGAPDCAAGMSCFSEMNFGWCEYSKFDPEAPPNCPNYTFSIAMFQRKLERHYVSGLRPPLMEAFFLLRLPHVYQENLVSMDCPTPLIFAHFLVAELMLIAPPWQDPSQGWTLYNQALDFAKAASPFQQHLMVAKPAAWPFKEAMAQVRRAQEAAAVAAERVDAGLRASVDFVVAHCRESLDWIRERLARVPPGSSLYVYEKCGEMSALDHLRSDGPFEAVAVVPRPDIGQARGDECSAYLTHIVSRYDSLADFTVFLQSDPMDHLHFDFLDLVLRSIAAGTYTTPYMSVNGPRHLRTLTPCLQAVHEEIIGTNLTELIGPYCCAQFVVSRDAIRKNSQPFYSKMLGLVDGSRNVDLCGVVGTKRSTQCYGFEFLWHIVFGEPPDPPMREDDPRLPVALRLKHGKEHVRRNWAGVPLARDIPLKMVPDFEEGNPMEGED